MTDKTTFSITPETIELLRATIPDFDDRVVDAAGRALAAQARHDGERLQDRIRREASAQAKELTLKHLLEVLPEALEKALSREALERILKDACAPPSGYGKAKGPLWDTLELQTMKNARLWLEGNVEKAVRAVLDEKFGNIFGEFRQGASQALDRAIAQIARR